MKIEVDLEKLSELRVKNGYSVSDMAFKTGFKTPTGYWLLEKGQRKVSVAVLYALAQLYDMSMEDLLIVK